ncbi:PKD domain-containing protein [Sphingobacterium kitahiroshimense]|uniref:Ig-like domain-containing protein n=1 Tax=Sphingobacterium kitahiroshimense TaxID=470446 RepID=UPI0032094D03
MRNTLLILSRISLFAVLYLIFSYKVGYSQTVTRNAHLPSIINPVINESINTRLRLYQDGKTLRSLSFSEVNNQSFNMPSYYETNSTDRLDLEVYYDRSGTGPVLRLHYIPIAKIFDRFWRDGGGWGADYRRRREVYLEFGHSLGSSEINYNSFTTFHPSADNASAEVKMYYKYIMTLRMRRSGGAGDLPGFESPSIDFQEDKAESDFIQAEKFNLRSVEAKFINIDESLMLLQLCNEGQRINLYDYFSDKTGVKFSLDGADLPNQYLNLVDLDKGDHELTAKKEYENGTFSESITLRLVNLPSKVVDISAPNFCEGTTSTLTAAAAPEGETYTYLWSNGETTRSISVSNTFSGTVRISNGSCEVTTETVGATMMPAPKPSITNQTGNNNICDGESAVLVTDQVAASYTWLNQNDEQVGTQQAFNPTVAGTYRVVAHYESGCSNISDPITITVSPNPAPTILVIGQTEFCEGESTILTAQLPDGQIASSYTWSDGQQGQTITVKESGIYTVTARNLNGCTRVSEPSIIKVKPNPKPVVLSNGPLEFCDGGSVKLTLTDPEGATAILWSTGETTSSIDVKTGGFYYVTVRRANCENTSEQVKVEVYPNITPIIRALGETTICDGGKVTLQVTNPQPDTEYTWSNGAIGLEIAVSRSGRYHVIAKNQHCSVESEIINVIVNAVPTDPKVSGNSAICSSNALTLTAASSISDNSPITYYWYKEGRQEPFETGHQIRYKVTKNEKIYVQAASIKGCLSERTEVRITSHTPIIELTASATNITQGSSVQFTLQDLVGSNPTVKWEYDFGDGFRSQERNPVHYYNRAGTYTVKVKAYAEQGCFAEIIEQAFIVVEENPIVVTPPDPTEDPIGDNNPFYKTVVYPNPLREGDQATLRIYNQNSVASRVILQVYSISGSPLLNQHIDLKSGQNEVLVENTDRLTANTYYLFVIKFEDGRTETIKVLVL